MEKSFLEDKDNGLYFEFLINPSNINWGYSLNTKDYDTVGGQVSQVVSRQVDSVTVIGNTGIAGRQELMRLADFVDSHHKAIVASGKTLRFCVPVVGIDLNVLIKTFPSIAINAQSNCYEFTMIMTVITNNYDPDIVDISSGPSGPEITGKYQIQYADTYDLIAESQLGSVIYSQILKIYNDGVNLRMGEYLNIPTKDYLIAQLAKQWTGEDTGTGDGRLKPST